MDALFSLFKVSSFFLLLLVSEQTLTLLLSITETLAPRESRSLSWE